MYTFDLIRNVFDDDFMPSKKLSRAKTSRTDEGFVVEIEVPGFSKEDISVEAERDRLFIKGEAGKRKISYSYIIPKGYNWEEITADVVNGLLTINIPYNKGSGKEVRKIL